MEEGISSSVDFLVSRRSNSHWVDWELPTGRSDAWTTAYVGLKLSHVPEGFSAEAEGPMRAAGDWLMSNIYEDGGWGYNRGVGSDADSTSWAVLFLGSLGMEVPARSIELLLRHQRDDGGFCTYLGKEGAGSWGTSHADVTPVALSALSGRKEGSPMDRGVRYVLLSRDLEGCWNSFWWATPLYATNANISFLESRGVPWESMRTLDFLLDTKPWNPFETALLASSLLRLSFPTRKIEVTTLVDELLSAQLRDGSWESQPLLRVTPRDCYDPWENGGAGPLFADEGRIFTTATVLDALCSARNILSA